MASLMGLIVVKLLWDVRVWRMVVRGGRRGEVVGVRIWMRMVHVRDMERDHRLGGL